MRITSSWYTIQMRFCSSLVIKVSIPIVSAFHQLRLAFPTFQEVFISLIGLQQHFWHMDQPHSTTTFFPEVVFLMDPNTMLANTIAPETCILLVPPYHCHILHVKTNSSISIQTMHPANGAMVSKVAYRGILRQVLSYTYLQR